MAQVEFREGWREVPDYLAFLMTGIETYKLSYDEARDAANKKMVNDRVHQTMDKILQAHFKGGRR